MDMVALNSRLATLARFYACALLEFAVHRLNFPQYTPCTLLVRPAQNLEPHRWSRRVPCGAQTPQPGTTAPINLWQNQAASFVYPAPSPSGSIPESSLGNTAWCSDLVAGNNNTLSFRKAAASLYSPRFLTANEAHHRTGTITSTG
jgi:hypothetical protein